ncbi:MAG: NADH-quinone oxidoreductase subunit N [Bdellovibrionota bacterium]
MVSGLVESLKYFAPNLILCVGSLFVLMAGLFTNAPRFLTLLAALVLAASTLSVLPITELAPTQYFGGMLFHDGFSLFFMLFMPLVVLFAVVMGHYSKELPKDRKSEYICLLLGLATGLYLMVSANHFIMIYLGIEMVSLLSYSLAGFHREKQNSIEASMKYVVYGALASGIMVFGMSLLYAVSGELSITGLRAFLSATGNEGIPYLFWTGVIFTFAGFGYKVSAAPMHMWTPDVYEGAPTPVAALFSVAPKAAGFGLLIRFFVVGLSFSISDPDSILTLTNNATQLAYAAGGAIPWTKLLILSAIFTMTMGNLAALGQTSVKRILAYSSIAHAGYMLMGLTTQNQEGLAAILFYLFIYCTMNLGAFWVASLIEDEMGGDSLRHFRGLGRKAPLPAILMAVFLFSLVGLPPFAGFIGKLYLFMAILGQQMYGLAVIAALNSVVSLYFYAKILKTMFLDTTDEKLPLPGFKVPIPATILFFLLLLAIPNVVFGLYWEPVMHWASTSLQFAR